MVAGASHARTLWKIAKNVILNIDLLTTSADLEKEEARPYNVQKRGTAPSWNSTNMTVAIFADEMKKQRFIAHFYECFLETVVRQHFMS